MQDWIAGTFAVLGTLMVLAGATLIVLRTLGRLGALPDADTQPLGGAIGGSGAHAEAPNDPTPARRWALRRLSPASQLMVWGVLLLVLAALTVGLISFGFGLEASTGPEGTPQ